MADEAAAPATPPQTKAQRADNALASSSPDHLTIVMRVVRTLLKPGPWQFVRLFIAGTILMMIVVALFGVPALLAMQALIDKWLDYKTAARTSVEPATVEQLVEQGQRTQEAVEQTGLSVKAMREDVDRIDSRVQRIEDAHKNRLPPTAR